MGSCKRHRRHPPGTAATSRSHCKLRTANCELRTTSVYNAAVRRRPDRRTQRGRQGVGTPRPVVLIVMDGWGIGPDYEWNAVRRANTPVVDRLCATYPYTELTAS